MTGTDAAAPTAEGTAVDGVRSWRPAEALAAVTMAAFALWAALSVLGGALTYHGRVFDSVGDGYSSPHSRQTVGAALQYGSAFSSLSGSLLLVVALVALWWQVGVWWDVVDDEDAGEADGAEAFAHLLRLRTMCRVLVVLFALVVVGMLVNVAGLVAFDGASGSANLAWSRYLSVGGQYVASGLLAVFGVLAARVVGRSCLAGLDVEPDPGDPDGADGAAAPGGAAAEPDDAVAG